MPMVENVKATVVLEFDISTTVSNAATMVNVEQVIDPVVDHKGDVRDKVYIRGVRVKSMMVEPKHG